MVVGMVVSVGRLKPSPMSGYAQQQLSRASISAEEQKRAILLSVIPTALSLARIDTSSQKRALRNGNEQSIQFNKRMQQIQTMNKYVNNELKEFRGMGVMNSNAFQQQQQQQRQKAKGHSASPVSALIPVHW
eukprot:scaffold10547_cov268-Chaetoceros_neogracile.AAC.2